MRSSDWSSDVFSSDLVPHQVAGNRLAAAHSHRRPALVEQVEPERVVLVADALEPGAVAHRVPVVDSGGVPDPVARPHVPVAQGGGGNHQVQESPVLGDTLVGSVACRGTGGVHGRATQWQIVGSPRTSQSRTAKALPNRKDAGL